MTGARLRQLLHRPGLSLSSCVSAVVLGMNDALVELTGTLAGFTMALPGNRVIVLAALTTGIAAGLSMAASEFLSQENGRERRDAALYAFCTGFAYLLTMACLVAPYVLLSSPWAALGCSLFMAALIIVAFTLAISRMRGSSFRRDCLEMLLISFGVAAIAFGIAWAAQAWWGIEF